MLLEQVPHQLLLIDIKVKEYLIRSSVKFLEYKKILHRKFQRNFRARTIKGGLNYTF